MSGIVKFQLHKVGVAMIAAGALLFSALVFTAGALVGSRMTAARLSKPALTLPPAPTVNAASTMAAFTPAATASAAPAPATPAAPKPAAAPAEQQAFTLRVAAFATEDEAKKFVGDLAARQLEARIVPLPASGSMILYTVCIGRYTTREAAAAIATSLAKDHGLDAAIVPSA